MSEPIIISLDNDVYEMIKHINYFKLYNNEILIRNKKGINIPIWRLARREFRKQLNVSYVDKDYTNLKRINLRLIK